MTPDLISFYLDDLLACACSSLEEGLCGEGGSLCGCPCRRFVSWGPPPADMEACCSDGALSVYLKRVYPYVIFPQQSSKPSICATPLAMDVAIQLWRCFPVIKDDGRAPTPLEIQTASESLNRDLYLLTKGVLCCLAVNSRRREFLFNGSRPLLPQGGCAGVEIDLTIQLLDPMV